MNPCTCISSTIMSIRDNTQGHRYQEHGPFRWVNWLKVVAGLKRLCLRA